ncbi:MAG: hypothetical protein K9N38_05860 [Candidatus Marinimicrobia bacterium]|nr:hypothetical protein [Candidatus Neomarinimicrobiota bacterium]
MDEQYLSPPVAAKIIQHNLDEILQAITEGHLPSTKFQGTTLLACHDLATFYLSKHPEFLQSSADEHKHGRYDLISQQERESKAIKLIAEKLRELAQFELTGDKVQESKNFKAKLKDKVPPK